MSLLNESIPWPIRASAPIVSFVGAIYYFHRIFHFNLLELLGVTFCIVASAIFLRHTCLYLYRNWLGIKLGHNLDVKTLGEWAIVTGATDGIGKSYAESLAKRGMNIILISRSEEKLTRVASEIRERYPVKTKIIPVDLTGGREIYEDVEKELCGLEIGMLVNNVGICYPYPEMFTELPNVRQFSQDLINCNMLAMTLLIEMVLPRMMERKRGAIVNVGSLTSRMDTPFMSLYGSSKAFVDKFTQDLALEYKDYGIIFQLVLPGYVMSKMSKVKQANFFSPTPEDYVEKALDLIGLDHVTAAWLPHQMLRFCLETGHYFRRDGAKEISLHISKQVWIYAKKVMLYRSKAG